MTKITEEETVKRQMWLEENAKVTFECRMRYIAFESNNVLKIFELFLRNSLMEKYVLTWENLTLEVIKLELYRVVNSAQVIGVDNKYYHIYWTGFVNDEIRIIEEWIEEHNQESLTRKRALKYLGFLKVNKERYRLLDSMQKVSAVDNRTNFKDFFATKLKKGLVNLDILTDRQEDLFKYLDMLYNINLVTHNKANGLDILKKCNEFKFNFENYKNPIRLQEFPSQKLKFQKMLKTWFLEQVQFRKETLKWNKTPEEYQIIIDYAESLVPAQQETNSNTRNELLVLPIPEPQYPKHIFNDYKSFELFNYLMQFYKTPNTISFLYRTMAEIENPKRILVKDTPFREWFNRQEFQIRLESHTKTYLGAKNEDRMITYEIAKQLIVK